MTKTQTHFFTVPSAGVGRADYSQGIDQSVEPLMKDWQSKYNVFRTFNILGGAHNFLDIVIDSGFVVIPFDFYLSTFPAVNIQLIVYLFSPTGQYVTVADKTGNQFIDLRLAKGIPFAGKWAIDAYNNGGGAADFFFSAHGIITSETTYFGSAPIGGVVNIP